MFLPVRGEGGGLPVQGRDLNPLLMRCRARGGMGGGVTTPFQPMSLLRIIPAMHSCQGSRLFAHNGPNLPVEGRARTQINVATAVV